MNSCSIGIDIIALVPAAGIGSRMQTICPKQYLTIGQSTVLEHSITCLLSHSQIKKAVVALSINDGWFDALPFSKDSRVLRVIGGTTRAESVLACLVAVKSNWVLVHDAVRPCLHMDDLKRLLACRSQDNKIGAILAVPVNDTIKRSMRGKAVISCTIERQNLWHALTPQFFPYLLLKNCLIYAINKGAIITDDSSALEYCGYYPDLISARNDNIKLTQPEDLALAASYLNYI
ncbi:2-C-methyl-D-erythritol 4-phosphate cytidylyltransferase [Candidatus Pantoea carbekii]|uniref:2-C-methyl-D-erythritol 4-phosphate cytidylyltransferase n=1 Tax=Candidatus Pantoea carbekii TaxID=1235990 RepID=U3U224_9GAMM|nr:2-C-methyl-D-erythritol 4-phosphate cytidylyltransferase [Candidatus Pantoea carbekii]AKC32421.1 2-C-methyl-D-erythritol 4-phosphate cytidylyltransferase [Candidatus Pantoea carbekii]BAO00146.1 IspD protein [Candidatus Pantoea carbekii]